MKIVRTFDEFVDLCKQRVSIDRDKFGVDSEFLPNPEICLRPSFCLIGMEPSVKKGGLEQTRLDIQQGYKNFLHSEEDFILHYCAYTFLCNGLYDYNITDLAKGAMPTEYAKRTARARYPEWLPLLRSELKLLGNPKTIAIGNGLADQLEFLGFKTDYRILHYSWSNSKWIRNAYARINSHSPACYFTGIETTLKAFSEELMKRVGYSEQMREARLSKLFHRPLPLWKMALLALYKYEFQQIRNSHFA